MKSPAEINDYINENIVEIVSHYITLKRHGSIYKSNCPFHSEKTGSFVVSEGKGIYKCFGCGKGGDAVKFIMEHDNLEWKEALVEGAKKLKVDFEWKNVDKFNKDEYQQRESLLILNARAAEFYEEQFKQSKEAQDYLYKERGFAAIEGDEFRPGYAPPGNVLLEWAKKQGFKLNLLIDAGLVKAGEHGHYDAFRNRLVIPICNKSGKVLGFTGRTMDKDSNVKWLNTAETLIFKKGEELLGLNVARRAIVQSDRAYLVEGGFDLKRLHEIGTDNTIAPCGTALTVEQILLLKRYTNKVTLVYDGDNAGLKAMRRNAEMLIKEQCLVSIILLPDKEDPDSLFKTAEKFDEYNNKQQDYLIYKVTAGVEAARGPMDKSELIKDTTRLVSFYDEPIKQSLYIDTLSSLLAPKKAWQDELKTLLADKAPVEKKRVIPKNVSLDEYQELGFYTHNNCYYFADSRGEAQKRSNCTLTPVIHIEGMNAKRLYEIKNERGLTRVIEITQKDMGSLAAFKVKIESLGNFWFHGGESDLNRLKVWLYEKTESAAEIEMMGWHKDGFFVWGNGVFNSKFTPVDDFGIVKVHDKSYYIPAYSTIFEKEDSLFQFERKFRHIEGNITLSEYVKKFTNVFGDNGRIALCFTFASLYRDIIINRFDGKFPLLNLFGPKGAGKNACAEALLHFFGIRPKVPNLHNTSKAALADHVATSCNAICVLDEYRNDLDMEKREFLKGLWDGIGRTRMNMEKDKKKEVSSVDQGVIVCGQQMATADIALFSRFMSLSFTQVEYTKEESDAFDDLKNYNTRGLTHLTHLLLKQRAHFKENYSKHVQAVFEDFERLSTGYAVETRILNNWVSVMAAYSTIEEELNLPWDREGTMKIAVELMIEQNGEIKKSDDLGQFWKVVQFLITSNYLLEGGDYKTAYVNRANRRYMEHGRWGSEVVRWVDAKNVMWLTTTRLFSLYKQQCSREGDKPLPAETVEHYLKNSKAFLFETKKESFKKINPQTGLQEERGGVKKRTSTTALVFDLDLLPISIAEDEDGNLFQRDEAATEAPEQVGADTSDLLPPDEEEATLPF